MSATNVNYQKLVKKINQMPTRPIKPELQNEFKKLIRINDEQNFVNRYKWFNLPEGFDSQFLERMLYYKYQLAMFYMEANDTIYILPFSFGEDLDVYGRWTNVVPLPFTNGKADKERPWIPGLKKKVKWAFPKDIDELEDIIKNGAVVLRDYTNDLGATCIPRSVLQQPVIDYEAEIMAMHRTSLLNSTGTTAVRVNDPESQVEVQALNDQVYHASMSGEKYLAAVGQIEMQNLDGPKTATPQEFMTALASVDNYRLSLMGLENGGITEKSQYTNMLELAGGSINTGSILQDGLINRLKFCELANACFGLNMMVVVNQDFDIMQETSGLNGDSNDNRTDNASDASDSGSDNTSSGGQE